MADGQGLDGEDRAVLRDQLEPVELGQAGVGVTSLVTLVPGQDQANCGSLVTLVLCQDQAAQMSDAAAAAGCLTLSHQCSLSQLCHSSGRSLLPPGPSSAARRQLITRVSRMRMRAPGLGPT